MEFVSKTDVGKKRSKNEDYVLIKNFNDDVSLFLVADGLGGYESGEVASKIACETILNYFEKYYIKNKNKNVDIVEVLKRSIVSANDDVFRLEKTDEKFSGMGTTIALLCITPDDVYYSSVGDSRIYYITNDFSKIKQITEDDTYVNTLLKTNVIKPEEAINHPQKHILTKAIGTFSSFDIEVHKVDDVSKGIILLCTDGVTNMLSEIDLLDICKRSTFNDLAEKIVNRANNKGGNDNITVVAIKM